MVNVKFNPSWNTINKRAWCQQATSYFRCIKSRLDKCPQQDVQNQFQQLEHYLQSQININCPGGIDGCTRHSTDARCKIGLLQTSSTSSLFYLSFSYFFLQSVLQILLPLLYLLWFQNKNSGSNSLEFIFNSYVTILYWHLFISLFFAKDQDNS